MNWCQPHWALLKSALDERGLTKFIGKTGKDAIEALTDIDTFDPLIECWSRINAQMLSSPALNGRILSCPLCILVEDGQPDMVNRWVNGCTNDALNYAIYKGFLDRK